eukprot:scaffold229067_cov33-Tisochrysis_lutea.AAC.4
MDFGSTRGANVHSNASAVFCAIRSAESYCARAGTLKKSRGPARSGRRRMMLVPRRAIQAVGSCGGPGGGGGGGGGGLMFPRRATGTHHQAARHRRTAR